MKNPSSFSIRGLCVLFAVIMSTGSNGGSWANLDRDVISKIAAGCTSIMVGRNATTDGSVITSHSCDGFYRTWMTIVPHLSHEPGSKSAIYTGKMGTNGPLDRSKLKWMGEVPEVRETYAFLNTAYPAINEHQLAMGETTLFVKPALRNPTGGLFKIEELQRLMLERCRTAREAIRLADELTKQYGYIDEGECLTIADPKEVWHFEIVGPTPKYVGAVWAAVRIPDDHVGASANLSRIGELKLEDPENFMASDNVFSLAEEMGWWKPESSKPFKFCDVYSGPGMHHTLREWRVLSLAAPSLNLDANAPELPFSVRAERKISVRDVMAWFRDTCEGTPFNKIQNLVIKDLKGKEMICPEVSPWMSWEMTRLLTALKPGCLPYSYIIPSVLCCYSTVIQCRGWLPDPVGGLVWLGFDNPAHGARMPIFCGITELPPSFAVDGQHGFTMESASWAFRRFSRLATVCWGKTRELVGSGIREYEEQAFAELPSIERTAEELYKQDPEKAKLFLTSYSNNFARAVTQRYRELGDQVWDLFGYGFRFSPEQIAEYR
jgi:dipeptidase